MKLHIHGTFARLPVDVKIEGTQLPSVEEMQALMGTIMEPLMGPVLQGLLGAYNVTEQAGNILDEGAKNLAALNKQFRPKVKTKVHGRRYKRSKKARENMRKAQLARYAAMRKPKAKINVTLKGRKKAS